MQKEFMYNSFPNFVLRAPLLSFSSFEELTSKQNISDDDFKKLFDKAEIKEAIFLATPVLFNELEKWLDNRIEDQGKIEKLKYSLLKYISRMSSRCTPFGLFAGCVVGEFDVETNIILDSISNNKRHTKLDMNYLVALSQNLVKIENIKKQILFFPNTSIYKSGGQLRYVEYEYINSVRQHNIMAVDDSIYLQKILKATERGKSMNEIIDLLVDDDNSFDEVTDFVEELISSQILISELEPSASGPEFLDHIKSVLLKLKDTQPQLNIINYIETKLLEVDNLIGNHTSEYIEISNCVKELGTDFDLKYLFQTDVILKTKSNLLSHSIIDSVKQGMSIFNKITLPPKETLLNNFRDAFYERFEDREMPLSKALDVEMGIGYIQNQDVLDNNPLIDDIVFPSNENINSFRDVRWSKIHSIFHKKIIEAFAGENFSVKLTDEDFDGLKEDWTDLPDTISTMIEIVIVNGEEKIIINDAGSSSSANLFGRFCHGDDILKEYTQRITNLERDMNKTKILAEINHLPESRLGNVLLRPVFREYEIPYLAKSTLNNENQLKIEDLYISVKNKKSIQLRSVNHNMEVIPRLSNSHNYTSSSLPIYHFLCDMQTQNKRGGIGIDLGPFVNEYEFIPRIEYKNLILSVAMWNVMESDIVELHYLNKDDSELIEKFRLFRKGKKIPQYFMLIESDNQLLINSENLVSVKMFLNTVKNKSNFKIKEFLFNEEGIVRSSENQEYYTNQIVLSFYNSSKLKND
jgi:hypothetical protein